MPSKSLKDAARKLVEGYVLGKTEFEKAHPGYQIIVTCTHRSPAEQQALYAQGRTKSGQIVTQIDGVTKLSNHNHNPSRAIDFAILVGGKITWDEKLYKLAGPFFRAAALVWGGDWKSFKDLPHIELPRDLPT